MAEIDLNIDNYSITDLINFFKLKKIFSEADLEQREYEVREQLLSSGHINKRVKRDLVFFLTEAKKRLLQSLPQEKPPTTIQKNAILDKLQIPISEELATSRAPLIIERPPTNYMNVQTSEYYQGIINPLNKRTLVKYITVDTRFRNQYYQTSSSDFMINLPSRINKIVSMQLTSIELPTDFYNISGKYGNNYFILKIVQIAHNIDRDSSRCIIIPDGNYTTRELISQINSILCPNKPDNTNLNIDNIFQYIQFLIASSSNKLVIRPNPNFPTIAEQIKEIILDFGTDMKGNDDKKYIASKLGWNLGFIRPSYKGAKEYISEKSIDPTSIKYLYLGIDDFNKSVNNTFTTAFERNGLMPNILARISMRGKGYENLIINKNYEFITEPRIYFGPIDLQRIHIKLFDDHGRILDMNHSDFSFSLKIIILYDL
jgi:hypothetical protein